MSFYEAGPYLVPVALAVFSVLAYIALSLIVDGIRKGSGWRLAIGLPFGLMLGVIYVGFIVACLS